MKTAQAPDDQNLAFLAPFELNASAEQEPARVSILAYSGGLMDVPNVGPIVVDLAGLKVPQSIPLLIDHQSKLEGVVGSAQATVRNTVLLAEGTMTRTSLEAQRVIQLSKEGLQWQASIGVVVEQREFIKAGQTIEANGRTITAPATGFLLILTGTLREITICALGCDGQTEVSIAAMAGQYMDPNTPNDSPLDPEAIRREERQRLQTIEAACTGDWGSEQIRVNELKAQAIEGSIGVDELNRHLLISLRASRNSKLSGFIPFGGGGSASKPGHSRVSQDIVECALALKAGAVTAAQSYGDDVMNRADALQRNSLFEMQNMLHASRGQEPFNSLDDMLRASAGGNSTVSLPTTLGNTTNRMLEVIIRETPATWRAFAAVRKADDFHAHKSIRPSFVGELEELGNDGEMAHGSVDEEVFSWQVDTYAKSFSIGHKTFKNDGVGFFDELVPLLVRASMRKLNDLVWSVILANAGNHFHTNNENIQSGGGSVLSLASLETAVKQMRKQRDAQGNDLDIVPKTLVVPPDLEVTAKGILNSIEISPAVVDGGESSSQPTGNALKSIVNLEVEPRIANSDKFTNAIASQWYVFAAKEQVPVIVAFLEGRQSPMVRFWGWGSIPGNLNSQWDAYHQFGTALADPKAGQKSAGG